MHYRSWRKGFQCLFVSLLVFLAVSSVLILGGLMLVCWLSVKALSGLWARILRVPEFRAIVKRHHSRRFTDTD